MDLPVGDRWEFVRLLTEQLEHERDAMEKARRG
jgi:hypothetical protein